MGCIILGWYAACQDSYPCPALGGENLGTAVPQGLKQPECLELPAGSHGQRTAAQCCVLRSQESVLLWGHSFGRAFLGCASEAGHCIIWSSENSQLIRIKMLNETVLAS